MPAELRRRWAPLVLCSEATGQKMPLSAATPQSASLAEMGGRLYQP